MLGEVSTQGDWVIKNIVSSISGHDNYKFIRQCDKTMVGFKQAVNGRQSLTSQKIECFYAVLNEEPESRTSAISYSHAVIEQKELIKVSGDK